MTPMTPPGKCILKRKRRPLANVISLSVCCSLFTETNAMEQQKIVGDLSELPDLVMRRIGELASPRDRALLRCTCRTGQRALEGVPTLANAAEAKTLWRDTTELTTPMQMHKMLSQPPIRAALEAVGIDVHRKGDRLLFSINESKYVIRAKPGSKPWLMSFTRERAEGGTTLVEEQRVRTIGKHVYWGSITVRDASSKRHVCWCGKPWSVDAGKLYRYYHDNCASDERYIVAANRLFLNKPAML